MKAAQPALRAGDRSFPALLFPGWKREAWTSLLGLRLSTAFQSFKSDCAVVSQWSKGRLEIRGKGTERPTWRTREVKLMFQHLQNHLYFCLKKLNILVRISKGVAESHKLVFCLCSKGPQINCTQFPEVDHCLRNLPGQAKSTRYFQDLMVMR